MPPDSKERANAERNYLSALKSADKMPRALTEEQEKKVASDEKTARLRSARIKKEASDKDAAQTVKSSPPGSACDNQN
jgi:hypothetical protein